MWKEIDKSVGAPINKTGLNEHHFMKSLFHKMERSNLHWISNQMINELLNPGIAEESRISSVINPNGIINYWIKWTAWGNQHNQLKPMKIQLKLKLNVYAVEMYQTAMQFQFTADILQSLLSKPYETRRLDRTGWRFIYWN